MTNLQSEKNIRPYLQMTTYNMWPPYTFRMTGKDSGKEILQVDKIRGDISDCPFSM